MSSFICFLWSELLIVAGCCMLSYREKLNTDWIRNPWIYSYTCAWLPFIYLWGGGGGFTRLGAGPPQGTQSYCSYWWICFLLTHKHLFIKIQWRFFSITLQILTVVPAGEPEEPQLLEDLMFSVWRLVSRWTFTLDRRPSLHFLCFLSCARTETRQ